MSEIINFEEQNVIPIETDNIVARNEHDLIEKTSGMLADVRMDIEKATSLSMPIAQLSTLGAGVSSLIPAFRTVTETTSFASEGLYRIVNAAAGDVLKTNAAGTIKYGALKTAEGASKMAQLAEAESVTVTSEAVAALNPATLMMAVALFSIEQELGNIAEMEKHILSFLEYEKEAEIEADVQTLGKIITEYKHNWDNERYLASNHKMVLDIKRTARKNMLSYQKSVTDVVSEKKLVVVQNKVNSYMESLVKKFKYYRLSLFTFSMASMLEVMLSGNMKEDYIDNIKSELESFSMQYRDLFGKGSEYLEKLGHASVEASVLKGIGVASDAVGKFIGKIPLVEKGPADEFLQDSGARIQKSALGMETGAVAQFAAVSNPGVRVFIEKLEDMNRIYNHTAEICFDNKQIYLIAG